MSLFPAAAVSLTPVNAAFLQASLIGLQHPRSVVRGEINAYCRDSVERALDGKISVLEAASDLTHALQHLHVERLRSGLVDKEGRHIPVVASTDVRKLKHFVGDSRWVREFLLVKPRAGEWDVPEMTTLTDEYTDGVKQMEYRWYAGRDDSPLVVENPVNKLMSFMRLGDLYATFIQPKGTRQWRFPPIPFVVGAMTLIFGERSLAPHFTAEESSLDELRSCLEKDGWPILIDSGPPKTDEPGDPGYVPAHGSPYDRYHMAIHDFMHALRWCGYEKDLRQDMLRVDDALLAAMDQVPAALRGLHAFYETRDNVLQSYMEDGRVVRMLAAYLGGAVSKGEVDRDFAEGVTADFRRRLDENFRGHPRAVRVLGAAD